MIRIYENSDDILEVQKLSREEWNVYWTKCRVQNLMQSWEYGEAKKIVDKWDVSRFLVKSEKGYPIAIVQVLKRSLPFFGDVYRINRGPLFLEDFEFATPIKLRVIKTLIKFFLKQGMRIIFFAPELKDEPSIQNELRRAGLIRKNKSPWASGLIDLSLSKEELFNKLNRRWKRMLRKAEDLGVKVRYETLTALRIEKILYSYKKLKKRNNFVGLSEEIILALSEQGSTEWVFNCYIAELTNDDGMIEEVGNRLVIRHGKSSTDFLVTSTEKGRAVEANSILYWHAILDAKNSGCNYFDIGGLSKSTPRGIADFKAGLNAVAYELIGEWWGICIPAINNILKFLFNRPI